MHITMPRSALRHRTINSDQALPPVTLRASRKQPEPVHTIYAIAPHDQTGTWHWAFVAGMLLTLIILLIGHLVHLPAL